MTRYRPRAKKLATTAELATIRFNAQPATAEAFADRNAWLERAAAMFPTICLAAASFKFDDVQLAELSEGYGLMESMDFAEHVLVQVDAFRALADLLDPAHMRIVCSCARVATRAEAQS